MKTITKLLGYFFKKEIWSVYQSNDNTSLFSKEFEPAIPPGCGIYPTSLASKSGLRGTLDDPVSIVQEHVEVGSGPEGRQTLTVRYEQVPFHIAYQKIIDNALPHFDRAIALFEQEEPKLADVLKLRRRLLTHGKEKDARYGFSTDAAWTQAVQNNDINWVDFIGGFIETYLAFQVRYTWHNMVLLETETSSGLNAIVSNATLLEEKLPYASSIRPKVPVIPVRFLDVYDVTGSMRRIVTAIAENLPNDTWVGEKIGTISTQFTNLIDAKRRELVTPIMATVIPEETLRAYDSSMAYIAYRDNKQGKTISSEKIDRLSALTYYVDVCAHEITHGLSKKKDKEELKKILWGDCTMWKEARAQAGNLFYLKDLVPLAIKNRGDTDMDPDEAVCFAYQTVVADWVRHMKAGFETNPYAVADAMHIAYMMDKGAITVVNGHQLSVDVEKMKKESANLFANHLQIITDGDRELADNFKQTYFHHKGMLEFKEAALKATQYVPIDVKLKFMPLH